MLHAFLNRLIADGAFVKCLPPSSPYLMREKTICWTRVTMGQDPVLRALLKSCNCFSFPRLYSALPNSAAAFPSFAAATLSSSSKSSIKMANSKYEYFKSFEVEDSVAPDNIILVRICGCNFQRFSKMHQFERPNDEKGLKLMNACAASVVETYPDIVFSYGFSDEYSFAFKKSTEFYQRRASKILSLVVSLFTSLYATKWKDFFTNEDLRCPPCFRGSITPCATVEVLQQYLAWRQHECHTRYDTYLWMLVIRLGETETEAHEILKDTQKKQKNKRIFQEFRINYKKDICEMFCQGSCVFKTQVEVGVKYRENGIHVKDIAGRSFWNEQPVLIDGLGSFTKDVDKVRPDYIKSFLFENKLMPSTWILIRIDGSHFHRFSDIHEFEKPNDEQALKLMNSCAVAVLQEFGDIKFSYGVSDEYSFILRKDCQFYQRQASTIMSTIVSFFSALYVMKWKDFFPRKELKYPPSFDGRAVCYPSFDILRDYLSWRQVDCHINNQYNSCFWMLVKSGKSKSEAQLILKGTQAHEKNELLSKQFGIDYNALPLMFRRGSSVFTKDSVKCENGEKCGKTVTVEHCDIIEDSFWNSHSGILD